MIKTHANEASANAEVFAYRIDRTLGVNLVPTAIKRIIDGKIYTLHAFVPDSQEVGLYLQGVFDERYPDLWFLDFLISNWDRNSGNSMYSSGGRFFAIDHAMGFEASGLGANHHQLVKAGLPSIRLQDHIRRADAGEFSREIRMNFSKAAVESATARMIELQINLPRITSPTPARPLSPISRLQFPLPAMDRLPHANSDSSISCRQVHDKSMIPKLNDKN